MIKLIFVSPCFLRCMTTLTLFFQISFYAYFYTHSSACTLAFNHLVPSFPIIYSLTGIATPPFLYLSLAAFLLQKIGKCSCPVLKVASDLYFFSQNFALFVRKKNSLMIVKVRTVNAFILPHGRCAHFISMSCRPISYFCSTFLVPYRANRRYVQDSNFLMRRCSDSILGSVLSQILKSASLSIPAV